MRATLRNRFAGAFALTLALAILCIAWSVLVPQGGANANADSADSKNAFTAADIAAGAKLYATGCATCHGAAGQGGTRNDVPSLIGVGAASAAFQIQTGRMPLAEFAAQANRKGSPYSEQEQHQLIAFVASLGPGPQIPDVDISKGDLALGGTLFRGNCANCHNFAGQGAPLTAGKVAPALSAASMQDIGNAVRSGPESMPIFSSTQLSDAELNSIAAYINFLHTTPDPGGNGLGRLGPIPEGLAVAVFGMGILCGFCMWIGKRSPRLSRTTSHSETHH